MNGDKVTPTARYFLPAGTIAALLIAITALVGWFRLEIRVDRRIEEKLMPLRADIARLESQRSLDMTTLQVTLSELRENIVKVRESLARLEGQRSRD